MLKFNTLNTALYSYCIYFNSFQFNNSAYELFFLNLQGPKSRGTILN